MMACPSTHETVAAGSTGLGRLLRAIFLEWDRLEIPYAVLRNAEGLPDETRHDVDVLVGPARLAAAAAVVRRLARAQAWRCLATLEKYQYTCVSLVAPGSEPRFVPIDLVAGLNVRCFPFADAEYGLAHRTRNAEGLWVVPQGFESATTLLKELLAHGRLKENSRAAVQLGATIDAASFRSAMKNHVRGEQIEALKRACQDGDWEGLTRLVPALRRQVCRLRPARWAGFIRYLLCMARHYASPPLSCLLVLVGPDGSGKSSLAESIGGRLYQKPFKVFCRFKSTFNILPPLKRLKNGLRKAFGRSVPPPENATPGQRHSGMIQPNPLWASMIYAAYYALDLWLGRLWLRRLRGQCALVVFDRYFYDYFYQIGNCRLPAWYLRLFQRLVPKPDLIIQIDRDAEEIYRQKPELTVEEIRREQTIIQELLAASSAARTIDARRGLEASSRALEAVVHAWLLERQQTAPAGL